MTLEPITSRLRAEAECVESGQLPGETRHHREDGWSAHARVACAPGPRVAGDHPRHADVRPQLSH